VIKLVDLRDFGEKFACEVSTLPGNLVLLGWSSEDRGWSCGPERNVSSHCFDRVRTTVALFEKHVLSRLSGRSFWFLLCFWDGWRERHVFADHYNWVPAGNLDTSVEWRGAPGELPILSPTRRWIGCYCAHRGDPSTVLLPDPHYLAQRGYAETFDGLRGHQIPWGEKKPRAVFCGGDHGDVANYFPPLVPERPHPRRFLRQIVDAAKLDVDVHLGKGVSLRQQIAYKWILDVDGFTRTWDAFAWKMQSGSVMLSPTSPWESFFTRHFEPWAHFVPIANDFSDLAERLDWCRTHDDECREIAQRARRHAESVYRPEYVARVVARQWRTLLSEPHAAPDVRVHHVAR
jgi:glycosyl transferase family 90